MRLEILQQSYISFTENTNRIYELIFIGRIANHYLKIQEPISPEVQKCKFLQVGRSFIVINREVINDFFANYYGTRCLVDERLIDRRSKAE